MIDIKYNNNNTLVEITGVLLEIELTQNGDLIIRDTSSPWAMLSYASGQWKGFVRYTISENESVARIELANQIYVQKN